MSIVQFMGYAAVFFGILGSWGLYLQAKSIWSHKSAESVSGVWVITFLAMFASFLFYGMWQDSFPMKFQGWLRVGFSVPVTLGFFFYGKVRRKHWLLLIAYTVLLLGMSFRTLAPGLFTLLSALGIWSSSVQAFTIWHNRSKGRVVVELQIIYLLAIICWLVYSVIRKDLPLLIVSTGFSLSYSATIMMWFKFRNAHAV